MAQINTGRPIAEFRKPVPDEAYKKWIRTQPCTTSYGAYHFPIEAAHTREPGQGGMGTKTDDASCIPLCPWCHTLGPNSYHAFGNEEDWAAHHDLKLDDIKADLRRRYVGGDDE